MNKRPYFSLCVITLLFTLSSPQGILAQNAAAITSAQIAKFKALPKASQLQVVDTLKKDGVTNAIKQSSNKDASNEKPTQTPIKPILPKEKNQSSIESIYQDHDPYNVYTLPELYTEGDNVVDIRASHNRLAKAPHTLNKPLQNKEITQFGYDIFENKSNTELNIPVSDDYILGPGDNLIIRVWGKFSETFDVTIDNTGNIFIPQVGPVALNGTQYKNAKKIIKQAIETRFTNFEISISMGELKSIKVFILGEVSQPGAYDISSLSTLFTALFEAGGPTKTGSLRNIKLKRNKKTIQVIDLYNYLIKGDNSQDPKLKAYDTIFVPPISGVIKITGIVKRPGIFELKKETSAYDAIQNLAGGFWAASYQQSIRLERISAKQERVLINATNRKQSQQQIKKQLKKLKIKDGDSIHIAPILDQKHNLVTISGSIYRPGSYELKPNMSIKDLLKESQGLLPGALSQKIQVFRFISNIQRELISIDITEEQGLNFKLNEYDFVTVPSQPIDSVYVFGAIERPGRYNKLHNMSISDLIELSILKDYAHLYSAELSRKNISEEIVIKVNLVDILQNPNSPHNITLEKNDQLYIRAITELEKPKKVKIEGEIQFPGTYVLKENETLKDIIERAGGPTKQAYLKGLILKRESVAKNEQTGQEKILKEEQKRLIYDRSNAIALTEIPELTLQPLKKQLLDTNQQKENKQNPTIKGGRIQLNISNLSDLNTPLNNPQLDQNDFIFIPQTPNSVYITGGVTNPSSILFDPNKKLNDYINQAGGLSEYANKRKIYLFKSNGSAELNPKIIEAGDTLYIPEKIKIKGLWAKEFTTWTKALVDTISLVVLIKSME